MRIKLDGCFKRITVRTGLACCCLMAATALCQSVINLGTLNSDDQSWSFGISGSGRVTGIGWNSSSPSYSHAFRTKPYEALNETTDPAANVHSFLTSSFYYISSSTGIDIFQGTGAIELAGECVQAGVTRPFWYFENGSNRKARILALPYNGTSGSAMAVSGRGGSYASAVVGYAMVSGYAHAVYWSVYTNGDWAYDYGNNFYPGQNSYATGTDINKTVGYHQDPEVGYRAFIVDNSAYDLATPSGTTASYAFAKNNYTNKICGSCVVSGTTCAILWTYNGSGSSSYTLLPAPSGKTHAVARDVNQFGVVVGYAYNSSSDEVAVYWPTTTSVIVLNNTPPAWLGWTFKRAYKLNSGTIVGTGTYGVQNRAWAYQFD